MTSAKPRQWKKEENERLGGDGGEIKFIHLRFERGQIVGFRKGRMQGVPKIARSWDE